MKGIREKKGALTNEDHQRIILESAWNNDLISTNASNRTFWTRLVLLAAGSFYRDMVSGFVRSFALFLPTYILTYSVRIYVKKKNRMQAFRNHPYSKVVIQSRWLVLGPIFVILLLELLGW
ncbi:hypothetical protein KP509_09G048400 [Ceratopteris richardii]|uniref:Uncharacterized protein n=1 Tax=Ceratopteris richardii TaxID=49495 RepID=A0A8T2U781_CERRI|nr:hypothetical protein KP509_09G048400 [Ceratopteris richardii]